MQRQGKVYIAGPMTGIKDFNFPAFFEVEADLVDQGYEVINPARHDEEMYGAEMFKSPQGSLGDVPRFDLNKAMLWDFEQVMNCDAIYMLHGWERSTGAKMEHALAVACMKQIWYEDS